MVKQIFQSILNINFFSKKLFLVSMIILGIYYWFWDFVPDTFSNLIATGILAFTFAALSAFYKKRPSNEMIKLRRSRDEPGISNQQVDQIPHSYFWGVVAPTLSIYILVSVISPQRLVLFMGHEQTYEFTVIKIRERSKLFAPFCKREIIVTSKIRQAAGLCHLPNKLSADIKIGDRLMIDGIHLPKAGFIPKRYLRI